MSGPVLHKAETRARKETSVSRKRARLGVAAFACLAAALALGAQGAWTGSQWLMVEESSNTPVQQQAYVKAGSRDTVMPAATIDESQSTGAPPSRAEAARVTTSSV